MKKKVFRERYRTDEEKVEKVFNEVIEEIKKEAKPRGRKKKEV